MSAQFGPRSMVSKFPKSKSWAEAPKVDPYASTMLGASKSGCNGEKTGESGVQNAITRMNEQTVSSQAALVEDMSTECGLVKQRPSRFVSTKIRGKPKNEKRMTHDWRDSGWNTSSWLVVFASYSTSLLSSIR